MAKEKTRPRGFQNMAGHARKVGLYWLGLRRLSRVKNTWRGGCLSGPSYVFETSICEVTGWNGTGTRLDGLDSREGFLVVDLVLITRYWFEKNHTTATYCTCALICEISLRK